MPTQLSKQVEIPYNRQVTLEGVGPKGKKFSYTEDARTAYKEATDTISTLDSVISDLGESKGTLPGRLKEHDVSTAVKADIIAKAKVYEKGGMNAEEAGIFAVKDALGEWQATHKSVLDQLGIKP